MSTEHTCNGQIKGDRVELSSVAGDFPRQPFQPVAPIDQVEVAHADQGPFVSGIASPAAAGHANQAIVGPFSLGEDPMR